MGIIVNATIDSTYIDADLSNHAIGIELDSSDTILSGLGATDYLGFHFTVDDVECYAEVVYWNMVSEIALFWVVVPTVLSSSDTVIKIENVGDDNSAYVGIIGSTPGKAVWDSDFLLVCHMAQSPVGTVLDSTANARNMLSGGSMTSSDLGYAPFGTKLDFDGINDFLYTISSFSRGVAPLSVECYYSALTQNVTTGGWIANQRDAGTGDQWQLAIYPPNDADALLCNVFKSGPADAGLIYIQNVVNDGWHYSAITTDGTNGDTFYVYDDGAEYSTAVLSGDIQIASEPVIFSRWGWASSPGWFKGSIGEFRFSKIKRSAAYIKAVYHNINGDLISKAIYTPPIVSEGIFGQISISGKNVNIINVYLVDKGVWASVENIHLLIDKGWRLNIIS